MKDEEYLSVDARKMKMLEDVRNILKYVKYIFYIVGAGFFVGVSSAVVEIIKSLL